MKFRVICLICVVLFGCIKEYTTHSKAFWENKSSHHIVVTGYHGGVILKDKIDLAPGENFKVGYGTQRGKDYDGFGFEYFNNADSLIVTFDNTYKVVHYFINPPNQSPKSYLFTSNRNLGYYLSYKKESNQDKRVTSTVYTYEFTEADYQFAL